MSNATDPLDDLDDLDFPEEWADEARDLFSNVLAERPGISGAEFASLVEAATLVNTASALDVVARAANYMSVGAAGQPVLHPAVSASTAARTAAAQILARLVVSGSKTTSSASQRAQRAASARWTRERMKR